MNYMTEAVVVNFFGLKITRDLARAFLMYEYTLLMVWLADLLNMAAKSTKMSAVIFVILVVFAFKGFDDTTCLSD